MPLPLPALDFLLFWLPVPWPGRGGAASFLSLLADVKFDAIAATGATMLTPIPGETRPGVRVELRAQAAQ